MNDEVVLIAAARANPGEDVPLLMLADLRRENGDEFGAFVLALEVDLRNSFRGFIEAFRLPVAKLADEHFGGNYAAATAALKEFTG